jgi:hypothetical protein
VTGKLKLGERDWLWFRTHSSWKSKKSDWLDPNAVTVREETRFGKRHLHVRNLSSFRKLRREKRFDRAQKKLEELWEDENSVLHYVHEPWDTIKEYDGLARDEALTELGLSNQLNDDILRLLDKLSGSTGDINALWRVIEMVGHVGRFRGAHPYQRKVSMKKVRDERVPWWHGEALTMAAKMRDYPEKLTAVAKRIHDKLKDRPDGPSSWDAVRQVLRRDLAKKRKSKQDD